MDQRTKLYGKFVSTSFMLLQVLLPYFFSVNGTRKFWFSTSSSFKSMCDIVKTVCSDIKSSLLLHSFHLLNLVHLVAAHSLLRTAL